VVITLRVDEGIFVLVLEGFLFFNVFDVVGILVVLSSPSCLLKKLPATGFEEVKSGIDIKGYDVSGEVARNVERTEFDKRCVRLECRVLNGDVNGRHLCRQFCNRQK
jgi:hypothetical protein